MVISYPAIAFYLLLFTGALIFSIFLMRKRNQEKLDQSIKQLEFKKEKELYQAKIDFFINVAHEIRTPLSLISGPLDKVINDNKASGDVQKYLSIMDKNTKRLLKLADQLLDFRKLELQGYSLNYQKIDITSVLFDQYNHFKDKAEENKMCFIITTDIKKLFASVDEDAFLKILSNLLVNAIKYAKSKVFITLRYDEKWDYFIIDVQNDGDQISNEIKEKIFEPFFRGENSEHKSGTGLGLPLARSLAEMHSGTLTLLNNDSELITFRLRLPIQQLNTVSLEDNDNDTKKLDSSGSGEYVYENSKPTILIVEDNEEMKNFLGREINTTYNVFAAKNGEEAITIMNEFNIHLIVSDIMMPIMDGFSLLKKVKTDINYSHIPVVLLTAKNTIQSRLEGLELGADAYIDKPFSMDLLLAQIANLLNNRNSIQQYYFKSPIANLNSMARSKEDEIFLESLNKIILKFISNPQLSVEMIADQMNMSRPTLYRKIKAISDLTPNKLIIICRLKKAAELILEGKHSLGDIAEIVGFSSQSYFSRSFSKQFGISPSDYAIKNKSKPNADIR